MPDFIELNIEVILTDWQNFAKRLGVLKEKLTDSQAQDSARSLLLAIASDMRTHQTAAEQDAKGKGERPLNSPLISKFACAHANERLVQGLTHDELCAEMRALRASVMRRWKAHPHGRLDHTDVIAIIRFNEAVDQAWTESVAHYSAAVTRIRNMFVGVLAHDIRSPMSAVAASAEFLSQDSSLAGKSLDAATRITRGTKRMQRMVNDLLDFTITRLGEPLPMTISDVDLSVVCRQAVDEVEISYPDIRITETFDGNPHGLWDSGRLSQVISNLLVNAAQHGDGVVAMATSCKARTMEVNVSNHCTDIPFETLQTMFNPLIRSQPISSKKGPAAGLGLGLYIVKEIVEAHQGTINVTSTDGTTTFTVRIPRRSKLSK